MRVVIAGGGTGGHLFPGVALANEFQRQRPGTGILFVGTAGGLETRIIPREGFELRLIPIGGWVGQGGFRKIKTVLQLPAGLWRSWRILTDVRPDLVIGVGGYASGPVVAMAGVMRLRRVLVEPNAVPGLTNRLLGSWVDRIYLSFEETRRWFRDRGAAGSIRVFGNPVRRDILSAGQGPSKNAPKSTLLVMGGSRGSRALNRAMIEALAGLDAVKTTIRIVHQSGERDAGWLEEKYAVGGFEAVVTPFLSPVSEAYRAADLVVCRSGATTVAELTACGRPSILIPFPFATHGHQEKNARALADAGAAELILERDLTGERLAKTITTLLAQPTLLGRMSERSRRLGRPDAAEKIVNDCLGLIGHVW
ncbi:MAG TPA: undecaprenyldiphospho-muramoylpentapeptide beta-N-acetylglucosaminyltransferase [Nitrospiria bacterium]|nr:undecaprenyldiphospho-muramoylpentapeptide beta-N-acetylglucosaminyltransferase [Nitrospiria bacterium]